MEFALSFINFVLMKTDFGFLKVFYLLSIYPLSLVYSVNTIHCTLLNKVKYMTQAPQLNL